ncbi:MAG TPA: AAA family ATPase [Syntrophorhabdales bacterium]|nr:AAA family ATPase [Syntrophorhabdales bacterium]
MPMIFSENKTSELLEKYHPVSTSHLLRYAILGKIERGEEIIPEIHGRQQVKEDVVRSLLSGAHPYLVSEEGTGKTRLARSITRLLLPVPRIKGCPYNDDPKWPKEKLCPRCRESTHPEHDFGIEWITGEERFSRIQGNEYTNEAKLLGLKDIQAIARGMSPKDPLSFAGTGVFHANRGLLFVDELPAIRTKVQVLLHPIIEEKKAILEEYNWEYPLDLVVVATGNPEGFSHVNEVPRPLLDRLETIYMDLPDEDVEFFIMMNERFGMKNGDVREEERSIDFPDAMDLGRKVYTPWWTLSLINKAVRQSRNCRWLDRKASIRGTTRAIDHTYSTTEMERRRVPRLLDVSKGLRLALRGRVQLRQDLVDFENPRETMRRVDEISDDLLRNALLDLSNEVTAGWKKEDVMKEAEAMVALAPKQWPVFFQQSSVLRERLTELENRGKEKYGVDGSGESGEELLKAINKDATTKEEYFSSTAEFFANVCAVKKWIYLQDVEEIFMPKEISWGQKGTWR